MPIDDEGVLEPGYGELLWSPGPDVIDRARASLEARIGFGQARAAGDEPPEPPGLTDRELRRELNLAENAALARLYDNGDITAAVRQQVQRSLDLEAARLSHDQH